MKYTPIDYFQSKCNSIILSLCYVVGRFEIKDDMILELASFITCLRQNKSEADLRKSITEVITTVGTWF